MDFCKQLEDYLINDQIELANKLYFNDNTNVIKEKKLHYWDLASIFCTYLNKHHDENRLCDEIGEFCLNASIDLCKNNYANPKEIILIYLENSSKFQVSDSKYLKFIEILKYILLNMPLKQLYYSFELTCVAIYDYIKNIELPRDLNLNENEKQVFDHDLRIDRVIELTNTYISFLDEFIERLNENDKLRKLILACLINLYDRPFGNLNTEYLNKGLNNVTIKTRVDIDSADDTASTNTIKTVRRLFQMVLKLNVNLFTILKTNGMSSDDNENRMVISDRALAVFAYVVYSKHLGLQLTRTTSHLPSVYSFIYVFEQLQPCLMCLIEQQNQQFMIEKGLRLSYRLFKYIRLDESYMDNSEFINYCNHLFRLAIYTNIDLLRRLGANLLNLIFTSFETSTGRLKFLNYYLNYSLYEKLNDVTFNSYVYSFIIYLFKDELHSYFLLKQDLDLKLRKQFENFYFKIFKLDNSVECDLMQNSNKITSTLNLLRFVLMMDKTNQTNLLDVLKTTNYLSQIEKAIQMSKAHYELEMNNLKKGDGGEKNEKKVCFEVDTLNEKSNGGGNKELTHEQKIDAMNISLNNIDIIEYLRVRCVECVESFNKIS